MGRNTEKRREGGKYMEGLKERKKKSERTALVKINRRNKRDEKIIRENGRK
jgi:hypothetical protein